MVEDYFKAMAVIERGLETGNDELLAYRRSCERRGLPPRSPRVNGYSQLGGPRSASPMVIARLVVKPTSLYQNGYSDNRETRNQHLNEEPVTRRSQPKCANQ